MSRQAHRFPLKDGESTKLMVIYCMQCGNELPGDARFCLKCGKPVGNATTSVSESEPTWEYCEIVYYPTRRAAILVKGKAVFWAEAIGPKGKYEAARSPEMSTKDDRVYESDPEHRRIFNDFIKKLSNDGWQLLPDRGKPWYGYKFRRKVS